MTPVRLQRIAGNDAAFKAALTDACLPIDDIEDPGLIFFKAVSAEDRLLGFCGVERCAGHFLLRSVVLLPEQRGKGLGRAIVDQALASLVDGGDVFLATTGAASFFARIGFIEVPRDSLPAAVLATRQLSSICPSSATIMRLIRPQA